MPSAAGPKDAPAPKLASPSIAWGSPQDGEGWHGLAPWLQAAAADVA